MQFSFLNKVHEVVTLLYRIGVQIRSVAMEKKTSVKPDIVHYS